jgi:hypothetical protein
MFEDFVGFWDSSKINLCCVLGFRKHAKVMNLTDEDVLKWKLPGRSVPCIKSLQWQIGKRKCASTCRRRMRGDVVRLREATTTTFFLEASEPAIAPCP